MYYNYHALAKNLIKDGHLTDWTIMVKYHGISPCLLLYFDNHKPIPIREHKFDEYFAILKSLQPFRSYSRQHS